MKLFSFLCISLIFTSCFKTAQEIRKEKEQQIQVQQSSQMIAELTLQIRDLQTQLANTTGQIQEIDYNTKTKTEQTAMTFSQTIEQLSEQVKILTEENKQNKSKIEGLEKEIAGQKEYINNVNTTLEKIAKSTNDSSDSSASSGSLVQQAHKAFEKNQQKKALTLYEEVLAQGKINNRQKNHVRFNLGLLNYWKKDYDKALVYFSQIYTKWPKSSWAPRCLLYIGRSFKKQKKVEEANATFQELIKKYPSSNHAKTAKQEIK